jgi:hypothetical protein
VQIFYKTVESAVSVNTVFRKFERELTNIDGKACNNIPEAVNKLALSTCFGHFCETGWNKHDSSYYSKQNSKFYYRVKFSFIYDKMIYLVSAYKIIYSYGTTALIVLFSEFF